MAEAKFEAALIKKLEAEGWTYRKDLSNVSIQKLENHWREVLNENNAYKLNGKPLSDIEFGLIKQELQRIHTPYDAQLLLVGAGGVGTLPVTRDDGTPLDVEIFYEEDVAGGRSRYEVVSQVNFTDLPQGLTSKRIIDLALLINGIPVVHIEEKDEHLQNQWHAFEQLKGYHGDGLYVGLFSFVQVQCMMSQHSAHYFARPNAFEHYNKTFVFGWRDEKNRDVTDAFEFAHQVLGIPALHRLVTLNMIPDASNDNLMVMRSYQIQATRAILQRMKEMDASGLIEKEGGYVWHTTGSGKTVTSFKVAQLLASAPKVKNILFIVDRVDLVDQTLENFKDFAYIHFEDRIKKVNGKELKQALKHQGASQIFLITVQGLTKAVKSGLKNTDWNVIIMDEAHRSANGESVHLIKQAFPKTTWFGFTGTPNFYSDDLNDVQTTRDISTHDIFGRRLHTYTIKDAIGDGNVLGFDITYFKPHWVVENPPEGFSEQDYEKEVYQSLPYREEVVTDILKNWQKTASGALVAGRRQENAFQAMFAVSGKQAVVHYYNLFKEKAPHLRVAMTFSKDESNQSGTKEQNEALKRAIKDYTTVFNAPSILNAKDPARAYMIDITKRLARKKPYNQDNENDRLDLVIVSDQLLTGFDSKYVNMIYMDKLLREGMLIQAMSRTNRTFDLNSKPHGKVRFYRQGDTMKEFVENALRIYTRGGNDTLQEANEETDQLTEGRLQDDDILAKPQSYQIKELESEVARLKELAGSDFSQLPRGNEALKEFVQRGLDTQNKIQRLIQQGYDLGSDIEELDAFNEPTGKRIRLDISDSAEFGALQSRINDAREKLPEEERPDITEIKIGLALYDHEIIDYDVLVDLLNTFIDERSDPNKEAIEKHILPMEEESRQEIQEIVVNIEEGEITEHFTTDSLNETRKRYRTERQELRIRRWAANQKVNGNRIVEAFDLFLPGHTLIDNPKLGHLVREIETEEKISFFGAAEFEEALMAFFNRL
ncbi:type I restriction endonuclease subunit R [Enterococcus avium]|uniref:type I site-specific deoxyribonuclease n=1 Tax=Enterococcus avium TaxID=33945 RepID=A0AAW8SGU5_ENTAV|nr:MULTISPECIES: type I restriction endonuclease subunit R [Enterococcus]MDT2404831.1 type I restriction endonuclease subunit R [Enterococcus avium]MDT2434271.1 type I restriction endonuclease subunit R [Enterococcus avium]MDT2485269.1 type I restriction endonuclease subunit R [Enterococcus avium]MDT2512103.1 type I restriction endonuclease subunit R [Enterococcus avium]MDT2513960.1 type I restriction endonuclease subunit R [Enterococcus avium]